MSKMRDPVPVTAPREMRSFRRRAGLKQWALADMLGVDQATVSRWERGKSPIDKGIWRKLTEIMRKLEPVPGLPFTHARPGLDEQWPELLRQFRITNNITQEQLSEILGCDVDSVSRWERGLFEPSLGTLIRLREVIFSSAGS